MLEAPNLSLDELADILQRDYGIAAQRIAFLPLGADANTAVFDVTAGDANYFLKLRNGAFEETSVTLPAFLRAQGNTHIIPIIEKIDGNLWSRFNHYTTILYPFVAGRDGFGVKLSPAQWHAFGAAFRRIHTTNMPAAIFDHIAVERYSPVARIAIARWMTQLQTHPALSKHDAITQAVFSLLRAKRDVIDDLIARASQLALALQSQPPAFVVCHSDIHAGNIFIDDHDHLYIVDWDNPIRAPKERDLMYFGGGQGFLGYTADEERALFFAGYGDCALNENALAYYRYERIVQDIYAFCTELLASEGDGENRRQSLQWLTSNFDAGGVIDVAVAADRSR